MIKTTGQLCFETIPQIIIQSLIFIKIFPGSTNIKSNELFISIITALINLFIQTLRLKFESISIHETLLEYSLNCIIGRVGWIPFLHELNYNYINNKLKEEQQQQQNIDNNNDNEKKNDIKLLIDYDIKYKIPLISNLFNYFPKMDFDFDSITINHFIAILSILNISNNDDIDIDSVDKKENDNNNDNNNSIQEKQQKIIISINFYKSLRFLGVHDIIKLLNICSNKSINLLNINFLINWKDAILISIKQHRDISNISNARDENNSPLLISIYSSGYDKNNYILKSFLEYSNIKMV